MVGKHKYGGILLRDVVYASIYVFGGYKMKYSKNIVKSEEELDMEIGHFKFLYKYNLL